MLSPFKTKSAPKLKTLSTSKQDLNPLSYMILVLILNELKIIARHKRHYYPLISNFIVSFILKYMNDKMSAYSSIILDVGLPAP